MFLFSKSKENGAIIYVCFFFIAKLYVHGAVLIRSSSWPSLGPTALGKRRRELRGSVCDLAAAVGYRFGGSGIISACSLLVVVHVHPEPDWLL